MRGSARRRAVTGGAAAAGVAAVAIGLLQAVQGPLGSLNPRWEVSALFALALLFATLFLQRLNARFKAGGEAAERGAAVQSALRGWPIPVLGELAPEIAGVFPTRRDVDSGVYVPRSADGQLADALKTAPVVVVVGPDRAGKSRTALKVAQTALAPDAKAVVPRDGKALAELLGVSPRLSFAGLTDKVDRVLWLDDVGGYAEALDARELDQLVAPTTGDPHGVHVVATVRSADWDRLLVATGASGEAAPALVARGAVLELPAVLDDAERAAAKAALGVVDMAGGIGAALASPGTEQPLPTAPRAPDDAGDTPAIDGPARALADYLLWAPASAFVVALAIVGLLALIDRFEQPVKPTLAEQAIEARKQGTAGSAEPVAFERPDFHGTGEPSYFFAFGGNQLSDKLEVWDQHGDELRRELVFEPREASGEPVLFQVRAVEDVDGDGADELIGAYGTRPGIPGELMLPFAIDWDYDRDAYRLIALTPEPPELATGARGDDVAGLRRAYANKLTLIDKERDLTLSGYRSQDFAVTKFPHRLVSAYVVDIVKGDKRTVELQPRIFSRTVGFPLIRPCQLSESKVLTATVHPARARRLENATLASWKGLSRNRFCEALF